MLGQFLPWGMININIFQGILFNKSQYHKNINRNWTQASVPPQAWDFLWAQKADLPPKWRRNSATSLGEKKKFHKRQNHVKTTYATNLIKAPRFNLQNESSPSAANQTKRSPPSWSEQCMTHPNMSRSRADLSLFGFIRASFCVSTGFFLNH